MEHEFKSAIGIEQKVTFKPMERHRAKYSIVGDKSFGTVIAVRFTKAKVFYDIVDEYWGILFDNIDSINVEPIKMKS